MKWNTIILITVCFAIVIACGFYILLNGKEQMVSNILLPKLQGIEVQANINGNVNNKLNVSFNTVNKSARWVIAKHSGIEKQFYNFTISEVNGTVIACITPRVSGTKLKDLPSLSGYLKKNNVIIKTLSQADYTLNTTGNGANTVLIKGCVIVNKNVADVLQIGQNSSITVYQNESRVDYDDGNVKFNSMLLKNVDGTFQQSPNIWTLVSPQFKHGGIDNYSSGWEQYRFTYNTTSKIEQHGTRIKIGSGSQFVFIYPYAFDNAICAGSYQNATSNYTADCQFKIYNDSLNNYLDITFFSTPNIDPIIVGDTSYVAIPNNITQESLNGAIAHLNVSNSGIYKNLLAYYPFDYDSTTVSLDYTNNNYDGGADTSVPNLKLNVTSTGCLYGKCLATNGITPFYPNNTAMMSVITGNYLKNNISLSVWAKANPTITTNGMIAGTYHTRLGIPQDFGIRFSNATTSQIIFGDGVATNVILSYNNPTSTSWHHYTAVWATSGLASINSTFYVDGVAVNSSVAVNLISLDASKFCVGSAGSAIAGTCGAAIFNGTIDEVMLFNNTVLNSSDVLSIYNNQSTRFFNRGELNFNNTNLGANYSINVTLQNCANLSDGYLFFKTNNGAETNFTSCAINNYITSGNLTASNFTIGFNTLGFYSPTIQGNITWIGNGANNVCLPTGIADFVINGINCIITTNENNYPYNLNIINGGNLTMDSGNLTIDNRTMTTGSYTNFINGGRLYYK